MLLRAEPNLSGRFTVTFFTSNTYCHDNITSLFVDESLAHTVVSRFREILLQVAIRSSEELFVGYCLYAST